MPRETAECGHFTEVTHIDLASVDRAPRSNADTFWITLTWIELRTKNNPK